MKNMTSANKIRPPAVAGIFYPASGTELKTNVQSFLASVPERANTVNPKVLIVPHAGYIYSGPVAASAYKLILQRNELVKRVVILGPSHRVFLQGAALPSASIFATPLGEISVDKYAAKELLKLPFVCISEEAHAMEHALEVQLPFLQICIGNDFEILPLVVGECTAQEASLLLEKIWGDTSTLIIISSDLSHYENQKSARVHDAHTCSIIENKNAAALGQDDACGFFPLRGLLDLARIKNMKIETLDLRNSGDTSGPRNQVVGYGAWAVYE